MIVTTTINGLMPLPDASAPPSGSRLHFKLNRYDTDGDVVVPKEVIANLAPTGEVETQLWPNSRGSRGDTHYKVTLYLGQGTNQKIDLGHIRVPEIGPVSIAFLLSRQLDEAGVVPKPLVPAYIPEGSYRIGEEIEAIRTQWEYEPDEREEAWLRNGEPIPESSGSRYRLPPDDDMQSIVFWERARFEGGPWKEVFSNSIRPVYTSPEVVDQFEPNPLILNQGVGQQFDVSELFDNTVGGRWSVIGSEVSIDDQGILSVGADTLKQDSEVTIYYTNSGGNASISFSQSVIDAAPEILTINFEGETIGITSGIK